MKLEFWVNDDKYFKNLLKEVTERDGKWRVKYKRDGKRIISFSGTQASKRAMLFKLAYQEPKGPCSPPETEFQKRHNLLNMMRECLEQINNSESW